MAAICRAVARHSEPNHAEFVGTGSLFIGQHLFTPGDLGAAELIADDRPYAAWLYAGARLELAQPFAGGFAKHGLFHTFELQLGIVGPQAHGEWAQREFHKLIDDELPQGWDNQLPNEVGLQGRYTVRALVAQASTEHVEMDTTVNAEVGLGTLQVQGSVGGIVRVGRNLGDPVADLLAPAVLSTGTVEENQSRKLASDQPCVRGWWIFSIEECYLFVGVTGRGTAFNAFLDGTLFHGGHSVDRAPWTYDLLWGARVRWSRFQLDYTFVRRSREFSPVPETAENPSGRHDYGAVSVRCTMPVNAGLWRWDLSCPIFFGGLAAALFAQ